MVSRNLQIRIAEIHAMTTQRWRNLFSQIPISRKLCNQRWKELQEEDKWVHLTLSVPLDSGWSCQCSKDWSRARVHTKYEGLLSLLILKLLSDSGKDACSQPWRLIMSKCLEVGSSSVHPRSATSTRFYFPEVLDTGSPFLRRREERVHWHGLPFLGLSDINVNLNVD